MTSQDLQAEKNSQILKSLAQKHGFLHCGISQAGFLEEEAPRLERWLNMNMHGEMGYMANHFDKRLDPTLLVPGAKAVVSLIYNYFTTSKQHDPTAPKISTYAYGKDYHHVIKRKMKDLLDDLQDELGQVEGRVFVDSAPVLDKAWAAKSGVGWIGKHSNLLRKQEGSFFFISELIIDLELKEDGPVTDHCGSCTACIDACPTGAIIQPYVVDGSKCISYFTIELKDAIPVEYKGKMENWMFGCDICQEVCPWNRFAKEHNEPAFMPHESLLELTSQEWNEITRDVFNEVFRGSAVKRAGYEGLKESIRFLND